MNEPFTKSPKLTVIVPVHNATRTLGRLLDSIPRQEWIEVVVVDDRSTDSLQKFRDNYPWIRILALPEGKMGAGAARNHALKNSSGGWLVFADADDFFVDGAFNRISEYLNKDLDAVYFFPTSLNESSGLKGTRHKHYKDLLKKYLVTSDKSILYKYFTPWSKMVSRRLLNEYSIEFDEVIASNDMNFSLKAAYFGKNIAVDENTIYCVTEGRDSLTKQKSQAVLESRLHAAIRYNKFLQSHGKHKYQIGVNFQLYNMRHLGFLKVCGYVGVSMKEGMSLLRGIRPLSRQIIRDFKGR